jgi:hypothetical protein
MAFSSLIAGSKEMASGTILDFATSRSRAEWRVNYSEEVWPTSRAAQEGALTSL